MTMTTVPMNHALAVAAVLLGLGLAGLLVRRNIMFTLLSIEIMLNAAGLAFIAAAAHWRQADGQVMYFFIITMAAVEVAVGLAMVLQMYHHLRTLDLDAASSMKG